jgi:excisionase family DNA binding protein
MGLVVQVGDLGCAGVEKQVQRGNLRWRKPAWVGTVRETISMAGAVQQMMREVMDIRQASEYLGISGDTLYRYASEGFIPAFKLGNRWRFKKSLLDAWMVQMSSGKSAATNVSVMPRQKKPAGRAR